MSALDKLSADVKTEFLDFFTRAQAGQASFVIESANKLKEWTELYLTGDLTQKEFTSLLRAHKRTIKQNLNTLEIEARAKVEKIIFGFIDVIKNKILS